MRRKVYTRDYILKSAYELVEKEGFGNFTARNVAKKMGVSTQPIYLEFENMQDLKDTLIDEIFTELKQKVFVQEHIERLAFVLDQDACTNERLWRAWTQYGG